MRSTIESGETDKFQRYITMLEMIPREPQFTTTPDLTDRLSSRGFEVTLRTVQRDLERLASQFGLICDESSRPKKWAWLKTADVLDIPRLSRHAALTFKLVQQHLGETLPPATLSFLQPYFDLRPVPCSRKPELLPTGRNGCALSIAAPCCWRRR